MRPCGMSKADAFGICSKCGSIVLFHGDFQFDANGNSEVYPCEYCDNDIQLKKDGGYAEH